MSKHPTSEFSARDLACIEYGSALMLLRRDFYERDLYPSDRRVLRQTLKYARYWRDLIFNAEKQDDALNADDMAAGGAEG